MRDREPDFFKQPSPGQPKKKISLPNKNFYATAVFDIHEKVAHHNHQPIAGHPMNKKNI